MSLKSLNEKAAGRFEELKRKKGWTARVVSEAAKSDTSIDEKKLQKMLDETPAPRMEVDNIVHHLKDKFDSAEVSPIAFIDGLGLPASLSIAIAYIMDYKKKQNKKSLVDAIEFIEKEIRNG